MRPLFRRGGACAAAIPLVILCSTSVRGSDSDKLTYFTFSGPVQVPGATLPAGRYEFRLVNPYSGNNVVRISGTDGAKTQTLFFATRNLKRDRPARQALIAFRETAPGEPEAIRGWFYPGDRTGYEFVYHKTQALEIARGSH